MILIRKLGLQLHEGKCHMSYITIYMLNSPLEVSFPAAEIFLVTPMHSNLEEIPCNMTFQSIHCLFSYFTFYLYTAIYPGQICHSNNKKPETNC